mmetsp:Transcript_17155/g.47262  ORF Transcript_17155/g.47262 Transcript_17155/m.47262 type:complete len:239 (+) Transcript_17155:70-786(+)
MSGCRTQLRTQRCCPLTMLAPTAATAVDIAILPLVCPCSSASPGTTTDCCLFRVEVAHTAAVTARYMQRWGLWGIVPMFGVQHQGPVCLDACALHRRVAVILQVPLQTLDVSNGDLRDLARPVVVPQEGVIRQLVCRSQRHGRADKVHEGVPDVPLGALVHRQVDKVIFALEAQAVQLLHQHAPGVHIWDVTHHQGRDVLLLDVLKLVAALLTKLLAKISLFWDGLVAQLSGVTPRPF